MATLRGMSTDDNLETWLFKDVWDHNADCDKRKLPMNEKLAMTLNELAAKYGEGYFLYLPARDSYKKNSDIARLPDWRTAAPPGMSYWELLYMRFKWSETCRTDFNNTSHRERYLKASFLVNPPPPQTPLYALQVISYPKASTYTCRIDQPSLTLYAVSAEEQFYLAETKKVEDVVGLWYRDKTASGRKKEPPRGADPEARLASALVFAPEDEHRAAMEPYRLTGPWGVFDRIVSLCRSGQCQPTLTSGQLQDTLALLKKPDAPTPIARAIPDTRTPRGDTSAYPPSRRGEKRVRRSAREKSMTPSDNAMDST